MARPAARCYIPGMRKLLLKSAFMAVFGFFVAGPALAADHASILMYHRFGEDRIPSTNIRLEQFEAHLAELTSGAYRVLPLSEIVAKLRKGEALPDRTVAITIDDAYLSTFTEGWPRLKKAGLPATLFVASEPVDSRVRGYLNWDQIRKMRDEGLEIGAHGHTHESYGLLPLDKMRADLALSLERYKAELGAVPPLFAYPFGEWNAASLKEIRASGFQAAFGQHSGVAHAKHDFFWLPRFPMNETYGDIKRVRQALNALPFPVDAIEPEEVLLRGAAQNPPALRFTIAEGVKYLDRMTCYPSQGGTIPPKRIDDRRFEIKPPSAFPKGRSRISCTLPTDEAGRFRWFGIQFLVP